jgi:ribosome production factor 1
LIADELHLHELQKRLAENVPRTLDNTREYDPSILTANPSTSPNHDPSSPSATAAAALQNDCADDIANDPFASYFTSSGDPLLPSKVLITTSPLASKGTCEFCDELVGIFPGAEFIRRKKHKGFELGKIAGWAAGREYRHLIVVNEDVKKPSKIYPLS